MRSESNFTSLRKARTSDPPENSNGFIGTHEENVFSIAAARDSFSRMRMAVASVIGNADERRVELRGRLPPWRMICSLTIESVNGAGRGTGWLVGPRTVITCGHCVYSVERYGGWAKAIGVVPGRSWRETPFGQFQSNKFSCSDRWLADEDPDADIGAIHLDQEIGVTLGWFPVGQTDLTDLTEKRVVVTGYPQKADSFENMWTAGGRVVSSTSARLFHEADTTDGQSGSPVWLESELTSIPRVIAVHAYEKERSPKEIDPSNSATLITSETTALITSWRDGAN